MNICLTEEEKRDLQKKLIGERFFDKEETYHGCTVQVLTNTFTGEVSVGWIKPDGTVVEIV